MILQATPRLQEVKSQAIESHIHYAIACHCYVTTVSYCMSNGPWNIRLQVDEMHQYYITKLHIAAMKA